MATTGFVMVKRIPIDNSTFVLADRTFIREGGENLIPRIEISREAKSLVTPSRKRILDAVYGTILTAAVAERIPMKAYTITKFKDPEEGTTKLVCSLHVDCTAEQALDFWDYLGVQMDALGHSLPERELDILLDDISFNVDWR